MKKIKKLLQCIRYRRWILGDIGIGNQLRPGILITSSAIIGNYNHIGDRVMIGNATIGNYCSFAPDVKIAQAQHSIDYITTSQMISKRNIGYSLLKEKTTIGNDVWIGANVVVMQGVKIGDGAVIGANAVVTNDIEPYSIAVGVPARTIRKRFDDNTIDKIIQSQWWNCDLDNACKKVDQIYGDLNNI